jgi:hypothetical protein
LFGLTNSASGPRRSRAQTNVLNGVASGKSVDRPSVSLRISSVQ